MVKGYCGIGYLDGAPRVHFLYARWNNMIKRCYDEKSEKYKTYGKIGIKICDRWHSFKNYIDDVQKLEGYNEELVKSKELQLDKDIKVEGNKIYSPDTCIWVSKHKNSMQMNIKRCKAFLAKKDDIIIECLIINEFCRQYGLSHQNVLKCLKGERKTHKGWSFEYKKEV